MILCGIVHVSFHRSPFSVVAALVPPAQQMAKRSHVRLHFPSPPGIRKSQNQERQIWKVIIGCQKKNSRMHRRHPDATGPPRPTTQPSEDRLQSKEDDDMTTILSTGVNLIPKFVTKVKEHLKKNHRNYKFGTFPSHTLGRGVFSHVISCGHHSV